VLRAPIRGALVVTGLPAALSGDQAHLGVVHAWGSVEPGRAELALVVHPVTPDPG
jgi:hypothetical protein